MNYTNLNKLYWIKKDIKSIKEELEEISCLGSPTYSDMPKGTGVSDPVSKIGDKRIKLEDKLNKKLDKYYDEQLKIEDYIEELEDITIRVIARKRFILNETWEKIGQDVNYDRTQCYKKLVNYLNKGGEINDFQNKK